MGATRKSAAKGFTLIELLVVVAIIALLIAVLLPSLGRAKERAKLTTCAAHLRALAQASIEYAGEWATVLPPMKGGSTATTVDPSGIVTVSAPDYRPVETYQYHLNGVWGLGLLYQTSAITDPRVYYCPSQLNNAFAYPADLSTTTTGGWLSLGDKQSRAGYQFQVHAVPITTGSIFYMVQYPRTGDYTPQAVLGCDIIWGSTYIAHGSSSSPGNVTFNSAFIDGHVQGVNGGIIRPIGKNPDGSLRVLAGSAVSDLTNAPATFGPVKGDLGVVVWDLDFASQKQ